MFQSFEAATRPQDGPPRLVALRAAISHAGLTGFLVPRADAHQGEYVAAYDARLAWLTGFSGSAGFAAILPERAGVFIDGRYRVQVRSEIDATAFSPVHWPEIKLADWLKTHAAPGAKIGFDPWLHTVAEIEALRTELTGTGITLFETANLVDAIWADRPAPPDGKAQAYPEALAGRSAADKRQSLAQSLRDAGQTAAILTLPDSIAWLLNIRGTDLPRVPVMQAFAILHHDAQVSLYASPAKLAGLSDHLGPEVTVADPADFAPALAALTGPVRIDRDSTPMAVKLALDAAKVATVFGRDPCILPKACKTAAEIAGAEAAHLRDGVAMVEFLSWLDQQAAQRVLNGGTPLTETEVVTALETFRRAGNQLQDISFDTICGAGPNGAIVHYRVTDLSNRTIEPGQLLLIDSGGQYLDGTTDITRTVAIGTPEPDHRACFTRVLQGMIAISRARFPDGLAGRDLDALARYPLWLAGLDYDHGTGHGVGAFLSVHEGPQRLSRAGLEALKPGMILSNEPGYYRTGEFGIRIENLIVVGSAPAIDGGDARSMLCFETLTYVPVDLRLVDSALLSRDEQVWLNTYHAETRARLAPLVSPATRDWLIAATQPI
ncbi:aminopeptidase P family protein [Pseudoruegeria sp. SK021]|uniref:aminopeptidase P family protein n=1 Tax=Pseudoruegeria sp. SK021 TaxID=1933035 RepID=UPI000A223A6F|nr:aminopeptidase P family protein [Pseudoruegeria sp. SK021]OSP56416.1 X-Pro aminopeptidase [Pseudoruegeria sp. SK021]